MAGSPRPSGAAPRRGDQPRADERGPARDGRSRWSPVPPPAGTNAGTAVPGSPVLIRYADDAWPCATPVSRPSRSRHGWPGGWSPGAWPSTRTKRRIVHLDEGVDFLGFNVRRYRGKLLIKPSKAAVKRIKARLTAEMKALRGAQRAAVLLGSTRSSGAGRPTTGLCVRQGVRRAGRPRMAAHLQVGEVHPPPQGETLDNPAGTSAGSSTPGRTGGCSATADSGAYLLKFAWTKITRHTHGQGLGIPR